MMVFLLPLSQGWLGIQTGFLLLLGCALLTIAGNQEITVSIFLRQQNSKTGVDTKDYGQAEDSVLYRALIMYYCK